MKKITKFLALIIAIAIMFAIAVSATTIETININVGENMIQEEIDKICSEMNSLAMQKYKFSTWENQGEGFEDALSEIEAKEKELEIRLSELNLRKIDSENTVDVDMLTDVLSDQYETNVIPDDVGNIVNQLLNYFSVYRYDGVRTVNGVDYPYAYIRVIDNKSSYKYTRASGIINMLNYKRPSIVKELLAYNFEYVLEDSTIGFVSNVFKYGWLVQWTIGNITNMFDYLSENAAVTSVSGEGGIYTATMLSVTQMTYYFVCDPEYDQWLLIGSRANDVQYSVTESIKQNINGSIQSADRTCDNHSFSTGKSWYWYIDNYGTNRETAHHYIGKITLKCDGIKSYSFEPIYYRSPLQAIY